MQMLAKLVFFELGAKVLLFRAGLLEYKRLDPASMCMF